MGQCDHGAEHHTGCGSNPHAGSNAHPSRHAALPADCQLHPMRGGRTIEKEQSTRTAADERPFTITGDFETMSTPNPVPATPSPELVAASPFLKTALTDLKVAVSTTLTGAAAEIGLRAGPAFGFFLNQLILLEPGVLAAEQGVANQDIGARIDAVIAKLP